MAAGSAAISEGGQAASAFGEVGAAAESIGDVTDLIPVQSEEKPGEEKQEAGDKDTGDQESNSGEEQQDQSKAFAKGRGKGKGKAPKPVTKAVWFNRDERIMSELSRHREWQEKQKLELETLKRTLAATCDSVSPDMSGRVENEVKLLKNRLRAVKLVLGEEDPAELELPEQVSLQ